MQTESRARTRPHLQVDGALQGEGLGLLDVLVAELGDFQGQPFCERLGGTMAMVTSFGTRKAGGKEAACVGRGYLRPK